LERKKKVIKSSNKKIQKIKPTNEKVEEENDFCCRVDLIDHDVNKNSIES